MTSTTSKIFQKKERQSRQNKRRKVPSHKLKKNMPVHKTVFLVYKNTFYYIFCQCYLFPIIIFNALSSQNLIVPVPDVHVFVSVNGCGPVRTGHRARIVKLLFF